jgi:hypothetical protein
VIIVAGFMGHPRLSGSTGFCPRRDKGQPGDLSPQIPTVKTPERVFPGRAPE